ncbi:dihydrouridine synthase [Metschnikowia bicuspidata var. bicuspidata NRRL YB-4993]|uniref:tRNA-dihydrouridine(20a/20b) synthase [NAD(P)+] n=1 Tax=Metschnikowia bicuspidata var. bicuspidata NRRL YB-4993 TaxID=869754 RepID=A0A1A0HAY8_9ASCO|nr:dihydrouridine synthase [Metschnikowia bicuspidata var. bicuspidata NRRL YB-4993]OBA21047.1 dihydrouridine synthase [Metschnikowia bicuspidata var. bicuspidata NRRL YB-4993]
MSLPARNPKHNPLFILKTCKALNGRPAYIAGPMVRYLKLPFRELVRHYNTDIVYTPMILAREFVRNETARISDFTTNERDRSVIVQVGCNNVEDLLKFVEMIHPYVDGIGLNCGCPIREQVREGIGAALMSEPELVASMVKAVKDKYGDRVCLETKIRIHSNLDETVRFVKMVEAAGVDFITVHGRTKTTRLSVPANFDAIKLVKESVVPTVPDPKKHNLTIAPTVATHLVLLATAPIKISMSLPARNPKHNPLFILKTCKALNGRPAYIAGPMVRYLKLPFRELVRHYNTDIVYTPMILAREFVRNETARISDFTTNERDRSVIVQVGCNNVEDLLKFVEMIHPYVDGIGLNCGCPIREQVREGIGAALMSEPELVASMVKAVKDKYGDRVCLETKIRIHSNLDETVRFVKMVEAAGVDFITVHGRTKTTRLSVPANFDAIKLVKESVGVPVVANGDCFLFDDATKIADFTGVDGVMAVRGILSNPALFAGFDKTPWAAVERFWHLATSYGLPFRITQHHLSEMMDKLIPRKYLKEMNELTNLVDLIDWFDFHFMLKREGQPGFATLVDVTWREHRGDAAHI